MVLSSVAVWENVVRLEWLGNGWCVNLDSLVSLAERCSCLHAVARGLKGAELAVSLARDRALGRDRVVARVAVLCVAVLLLRCRTLSTATITFEGLLN